MTSASVFCGDSTELLGKLCDAAEAEIRLRLKDGTQPEDFLESFVTASAFLASAMFFELTPTNTSSCKIGNVSFGGMGAGGGLEIAKALRSRAEVLMAPHMQDGGFSFVRVRG